MALVEIARFSDVVEADLAAAFLQSHDVPVSVTERFQTTVDPLMQRALGIRLMAPASEAVRARGLLARARAGEFADTEGDDLEPGEGKTRSDARYVALAVYLLGGFWGNSLPRRWRPVAWPGVLMVSLGAAVVIGFIALARWRLSLDIH